uniref:Transient receptor ion channel domain-containing protein n=1 Tax=Caenorhabditis japonica TaxID=281687 RepID=A0A8R1DI46_CAEJA
MCRRQTVSTRANTRLADVMRALSSEAYLWLATDDVFAATCAIAKDLQQLIEEDELEQIEIYRVLEANVQRFMARLADQAWRAEEFNAVVANKNHCGYHNTEVSSPRLQLAMDSQMRQFTCSANTQTAIKSIFRADWYNFGNKPKRDAWRLLRTSFLMPFVVILHAIMPTMGTTMAIPLARYMAHISMYLLFLFTAVARPTIGYSNEWQTPNDFRITALEMFMYSYVFGLIVEKGMLMKRIGPDTFFAYWWRWFDIFFISSYSVSFFFFVCTKVNREQFDPADIDRMHWPSNEFLLLHEIFLSIACVFGISKCFYYLQMMKGIGGSIISVGKCVGKTYTYLVIMVIVIVSFSVGLNILVGPYVNRKLIRPDGSTDAETTDSYDTIGMTTKNLFWSIFGYLGPSTYITVVGNTGYHMDPVSHQLNSATLEVLGALYHGIIIITVLNLMTSYWWLINFLQLDRRFESPSWGRDVDKVDEAVGEEELKEEEHNTYRYLEILCTLFSRFCASKECKYRTVWRTEFDKEQKQLTTVSFLSAGPHAFPMDNTYEGWRWRSSKILHLPPAPPNPDFLAAPYIMKGTAREAVMVYKARDVEGHTAQEGPQSEVNVEIPTKPAVAPPPAPPPPQVLVVPVKKPGPNLV